MHSPLSRQSFPFARFGFTGFCRWLILSLALHLAASPALALPEITVKLANASILDSTTVNFGTVTVGDAPFRDFTVTNDGNTTLTGIAFTKNGAAAADYTLSGAAPTFLLPGNSFSFRVTFAPSVALPRTAAIHIASNDLNENPFDINFTGIGSAPDISVTAGGVTLTDGASTVNFGKVRVGLTGTRLVAIRNTGNSTLSNLSLSLSGGGYSVTALQVTSLASGATTQVTLSFSPSGTAISNGTLQIFSNDTGESPFDIALTGSGVIPLLDVESPPGTLIFDGADNIVLSSPVGVAIQREFLLRNVSGGILTGLALSLDGAGAGSFSVTSLPGTTLAPGATMSFTLSFTPTGPDSVSAAVHIASDQSFGDPFDIALTGEAVTLPDEGDEDGDGILNMLETALGTDPLVFNSTPGILVKNGANLEFVITRSIAAQTHTALSVEFNDALDGIWTPVDISSAVLESDNGTIQQLRYIFPAGDSGRRFVRLRATKL